MKLKQWKLFAKIGTIIAAMVALLLLLYLLFKQKRRVDGRLGPVSGRGNRPFVVADPSTLFVKDDDGSWAEVKLPSTVDAREVKAVQLPPVTGSTSANVEVGHAKVDRRAAERRATGGDALSSLGL